MIIIMIIISVIAIAGMLIIPMSVERTILDEPKKTKLNIQSIFNLYGYDENFKIVNGDQYWYDVQLELNPANNELYEKLSYVNDESTIIVSPIFTAAAYSVPGFYNYYRGECGEECLTVELQKEYFSHYPWSGSGLQALKLLGYETISDIKVDQNPDILKKYDKVILLHNEYVTKKEFNAITQHPNVIYLYPNSLYAEVNLNSDNTITLVRGHSYPTQDIINGFDWKFDNTPQEFDRDCNDLKFYEVENGWMLNCYPEEIIYRDEVLLGMIKEI
jgi:hypothetical protein